MKRFLLIIWALFPLFAYSQKIEPTKWTVSLSKNEVKVGDKVEVIFSVTIQQDWYMYAVGDNPPQMTISFLENPSFALAGKIKEGAGVKEKYDENLEINVRYFEKKAEFRQTIKILKENPKIEIEVEGQACSLVNGQCVRVTKGPEDLQVPKLKVVAGASDVKTNDVNGKKEPKDKAKDNLAELEKEKEKLVKKNSAGKDESVEYLKDFVKKYGQKQ